MEQLVHLRLKSIYKAFKQTSGGTPATRALKKNDIFSEDAPAEDAEALMMAAAAASALTPPLKKAEATSRRERHKETTEQKTSKEEFEKKVQRADDAAAALLAELDEEEQAEKTKKNKKKKKKERQQAKKGEERRHGDDRSPSSPIPTEENQPAKESLGVLNENNNHDHKSSTTSQDVNESTAEEAPLYGSKSVEAKDPLEEDFERMAEDEDIEGLEELLASVKGVPGKAILRKNIKKAIKRLRAPPEQPEPAHEIVDSGFIPVPDRVTSPSTEGRAGMETPVPTEDDARVAELLKIVSYTHNKTPNAGHRTKIPNPKGNSECIMQMAPMIVGWVIGKGGQRIRDLMEESGARIWIDQDSMKPQDPRVVYVSGSRKNVDAAVRMIKDLISRAPGETPKSHQSTPGAEAATAKTFIAATPGKGPGVPKDLSGGGETFQLKPRDSSTFGTPKTQHEMTCDPRFVPLLIGRRGWTIKNIQDASGARIDIDQTVIPRKITISGSETSVEIAKGMVSDVLSYPQSQLYGLGEDEEEGDLSKPVAQKDKPSTTPKLSPVPTPLVKAEPAELSSPVCETGESPPPPAAEIVAGDSKDLISASSSLSSTPEPTISVKGTLVSAPVQTTGLFPPRNAVASFKPTPGLVSDNPFAQRSVDVVGITPQEAGKNAFAPPPPPLAPGNPSFSPFVGGPGPLYPPHPGSGFEGQAFGNSNRFPQGRQPPPYGNSAFHAARQGLPMPVASPLLDRPVVTNPASAGSKLLPGIWNQPNQTVPVPAPGQGEFGLAAAVEFLQHNQPQQQMDIPPTEHGLGRLASSAPPAGVFPSPAAVDAGGMFGDPVGKDESNIVDSLFGPTEVKNNEVGLIAGLGGLDLGPSPEVSSIWGNGVSENEKRDSLPGLAGLLSDSQPSAASAENNHSRFAWGSST